MKRAEATGVTGGKRHEKVFCLRASDLTHDQSIRTHAQGLFKKFALIDLTQLSLRIAPREELGADGVGRMEFGRVFNDNGPLRRRNRVKARV